MPSSEPQGKSNFHSFSLYGTVGTISLELDGDISSDGGVYLRCHLAGGEEDTKAFPGRLDLSSP